MKVPLIARTFVRDGKQVMKYWFNSKATIVKAPILPYVYSPEEIFQATCTQVSKQLLYDKDYRGNIWKCEFRHEKDLRQYGQSGTWEDRVKFLDRVYIDEPEFAMQYPNDEELKILSLDIETDSFQTFPNPKENAVIAIGMQLNDEPIEILMAESFNNDHLILKQMVRRIKELDPDIIVTYNGTRFDFPYLCERMRINRLDPARMSRDGSEIMHIEDKDGILKETRIGGRIHYDIMIRSVKDGQKIKDQNLFFESPKHYDMKTIAKIYKCPNVIKEPKEIMSNMRSIVNTEQLYNYLESDIRCTTHLRKIYLPALIKQAEDLQVSLDSVIHMTPSYTGSIIFARKFGRLNIIGDKTVGEAHPVLSAGKQGALVKTYRWGLFKGGVRDVDFTSFYPNLIRQLNLCPTTTTILGTEPELKPYKAYMTDDNHLRLSIPDEVAKCQIIIDIDMNKRGIAADFVAEMMEDRAAMKAEMKKLKEAGKAGGAEYNDLDVNQLNLKVIINALSGFFGQKYARFGSLASYIAITGSGRYILQAVKDFMDSDGNNNVIAINTDGLYLTNGPDLDTTHKWLEQWIKDTYFSDTSYIWLENSTFEAAYFQPGAEKHYLLLHHPDKEGNKKLTIHGGGLKGSAKLPLYSDVINEIGYKMLDSEVTTKDVDPYYDKKNWSLDKMTFGRNVKLKRDYKNPNELGMQLIKQYEERFNVELKEPTKLTYVKIKLSKQEKKRGLSKYQLVTIFDKLEDIPNIDIDYYVEEVDKALERLSLEKLCPKNRWSNGSLFDFGMEVEGESQDEPDEYEYEEEEYFDYD
jgi:DNA polymerase I